MKSHDTLEGITLEGFREAKDVSFLCRSSWKRCMYHISGIITLGLAYLLFYWKNLHHLLYDDEDTWPKAEYVLIVTNAGKIFLLKIKEELFVYSPFDASTAAKIRYIEFARAKYTFNFETQNFERLETRFAGRFEKGEFFGMDRAGDDVGLRYESMDLLNQNYGTNKLEIEVQSTFLLCLRSFFQPLCVAILFLSVLAYMSYKYAQAISYCVYVLLIIVFEVVEIKSKESRIKKLNDNTSIVKVYRKHANTPSKLLFKYFITNS